MIKQRYLVSCSGHCLCDVSTQETITFTKTEAKGALMHLARQGLKNAQMIKIQIK